jgi:hypothetical protein
MPSSVVEEMRVSATRRQYSSPCIPITVVMLILLFESWKEQRGVAVHSLCAVVVLGHFFRDFVQFGYTLAMCGVDAGGNYRYRWACGGSCVYSSSSSPVSQTGRCPQMLVYRHGQVRVIGLPYLTSLVGRGFRRGM